MLPLFHLSTEVTTFNKQTCNQSSYAFMSREESVISIPVYGTWLKQKCKMEVFFKTLC